jgi:hypothetical protein
MSEGINTGDGGSLVVAALTWSTMIGFWLIAIARRKTISSTTLIFILGYGPILYLSFFLLVAAILWKDALIYVATNGGFEALIALTEFVLRPISLVIWLGISVFAALSLQYLFWTSAPTRIQLTAIALGFAILHGVGVLCERFYVAN